MVERPAFALALNMLYQRSRVCLFTAGFCFSRKNWYFRYLSAAFLYICNRWAQLARRREEEELVNGARSEDLDGELELHRVIIDRPVVVVVV